MRSLGRQGTRPAPTAALLTILFLASVGFVSGFSLSSVLRRRQSRPTDALTVLSTTKIGITSTADFLNSTFPKATTAPTTTNTLLTDFCNDIDALAALRPPTTDADISAPVDLISKGSSYTRLWTTDTWDTHSRPPHLRYAKHILQWHTSKTARQILPTVLMNVVWATFLSLLSKQNTLVNDVLVQVSGSTTAVSLLTAPLALLLTLRANNSLSRLGEARALWGKLVLHCRTLSGLLRVHTLAESPSLTMAAGRHISLLGWSIKAFVRGESAESEEETFRTLLDDATVDWLIRGDQVSKKNESSALRKSSLFHQPPSRIALSGRLRQICAMAVQDTEQATGKQLYTPQLLMEEQIASLEQVVGGCERLHGSPTIPPTYSRHLSRVISMFLFFMPIGLVSSSISLINTVLVSAVASYVFVGIDEVGMEVENAFSLLPLQQLASAAHNGVRDQLVCLNDAPPII